MELLIEKKPRPGDLIPSENVLAENQKIFDPLLFKILVSDIDYRELIEIRDIMERGVFRLVIENATDEQLGLLRDVMDQMDALHQEGASDRKAWDDKDIQYQRIMGQITHHMIVNNMYEFIVEVFAPTINARLGYHAYRALQ